MPIKRQLHQSDPTPFIISPKRPRNIVNLMPMPPPIELPPDTLQASDDEKAQEIITAPEVNPYLLPQYQDDPFDSSDHVGPEVLSPINLAPGNAFHVSDQDKSMILPPTTDDHRKFIYVSIETHPGADNVKILPRTTDNRREFVYISHETHSGADTIDVAKDSQEAIVPSDHDTSKVTSSALHHH